MARSAKAKPSAAGKTKAKGDGIGFQEWAAGFGPIRHKPATRARVRALARRLEREGGRGDGVPLFEVLHAADRLASAGMWLVVHQTYARNVYLDGRDLATGDFKARPEGHTGGSLNMAVAYAGYLAAGVVSGLTRAWLMGQGHCVSAIDSLNLLVGNLTPEHAARYDVTDAGLTRFVRDFYAYRLGDDGRPECPLGSHVNVHTAGGISEGGYLGFAELQYVHMPLPGERLVTFLSDGAFEEQRGSDWAPRWWRAEDSGSVVPIMINNGRRIDQRTTMSQQGGAGWFVRHLRLNGFDPVVFDGRDPAAFVWAILELEARLAAAAEAVRRGRKALPVRLPYGVAVAPKGAGFPGAGTNLAHNLPLGTNPAEDPKAAESFRRGARRLWVPETELRQAADVFGRHRSSRRPRERDHPLVHREAAVAEAPEPELREVAKERADPGRWTRSSPMAAVDAGFLAVVKANPRLRPRVGNPDEMRSNRMLQTLEALKFRVTAPEKGVPEATLGAVVTALNEEAVVAAALANKGGLNLTVTYEAFGMKMHGAVRQEVIWADQANACGRPPRWPSIALVLTSHTWENTKNERSHQDPSLAEALLGEPADVSRVVFPADHNSAALAIREAYRTRGQLWTLVVPKADRIPDLFPREEAEEMVREGALALGFAGHEPDRARLVLTAAGAYQLEQVLRASRRLAQRGVAHRVVYLFEPGRFRAARSEREEAHQASHATRERLFPEPAAARLFVSHTRPEALLGVLGPLHTGQQTAALGYVNHGGTLDTPGMLFVNRSTWAHVVARAGGLVGLAPERLLTGEEIEALECRRAPAGVIL